MNLKETRVFKLKQFIENNGGQAKVSRKYNVDASYLSQIVNGYGSFGEKSARKLETTFNLPPYYFDSIDINQNLANYEVMPAGKPLNTVPLISWVQAGAFTEAVENIIDAEQISTDAKVSQRTFALRVKGDSMQPLFQPGMILIVEPNMVPISGDFVIAKNGDNEATFKQLMQDGADWYLKPLNAQYPTKSANHVDIIGVVIQSVTKFK